MKLSFAILLASLTPVLTAPAMTLSIAPNVSIESKIIVPVRSGGERALRLGSVVVASGSYENLDAGDTECTVSPTLLKSGGVAIHAVLTVHHGKDADQVTEVQMTTQVGQVAEFRAGKIGFAVTMTPHE